MSSPAALASPTQRCSLIEGTRCSSSLRLWAPLQAAIEPAIALLEAELDALHPPV